MANSFGAVSGAIIAQQSLPILLAKFPLLKTIATDFSGEAGYYNQVVNTRILGVGAAQTYNPTTGYLPQNANDTTVAVTINTPVYTSIAVNDLEASSTGLNLIEEHAEDLALVLGERIMSDIAATFVTTSFPNTMVVSVGSANRTTLIVAGKQALDTRNVRSNGRFAIFNPAYVAALWADQTVLNLTSGGPGNRADDLPVLHGFTINEYSGLPSNSINLAGVMGNTDAIAFASRVPTVPIGDVPIAANITNVTDPDSGLSLQVRDFYNPQLGQRELVFSLMYGIAVGNPASLELITTS